MPSGIPANHTGKRFGRLLVLGLDEDTRCGKQLRKNYICRCDCGTIKTVAATALTSGSTRSCGCLHRESIGSRRRTHGASGSPTYESWRGMRERVENPKNSHYKNYGGRGIKIDPSWCNFETFLADMGERPDGTSLDRIDNDKGYSKANCRWATVTEQTRNTTRTVMIEWKGHRRCLADWAELFGVNAMALRSRIDRWGGDIDLIFTTPFQNDRRRISTVRSPAEVLELLNNS